MIKLASALFLLAAAVDTSAVIESAYAPRDFELNLVPLAQTEAIATRYGGHAMAHLDVVAVEYGDGERWEVHPKDGARTHAEAFPQPVPRLGGARIGAGRC